MTETWQTAASIGYSPRRTARTERRNRHLAALITEIMGVVLAATGFLLMVLALLAFLFGIVAGSFLTGPLAGVVIALYGAALLGAGTFMILAAQCGRALLASTESGREMLELMRSWQSGEQR